MTLVFLTAHSLQHVKSERRRHNVSESLMAMALCDLERDGYKRAAIVVGLLRDLEPGHTLELEPSALKALGIAYGCSHDTQRLLGPLLNHRYVTRA